MKRLAQSGAKIKIAACFPRSVKWLFHAGLEWLTHNQERVNRLNVFPVPDGDTGKNMCLTLHKGYDAVASMEREMIIDALKNTRGNITFAAKILQTTVRKFAYKAQRYGVDYKHYR